MGRWRIIDTATSEFVFKHFIIDNGFVWYENDLLGRIRTNFKGQWVVNQDVLDFIENNYEIFKE